MTFSFLWWLSMVKAPTVKKKTNNKQRKKKTRLAHGTNTLLIEVVFIFVWRSW